MDSIDLRDRYPEIERKIRLNGSPESVRISMTPVLKNLERIINVINDIAYWKDLEYEKSFVFQSRAMGTAKPTSDIDIYVKLSNKHEKLVINNGVQYKNTGIIVIAGEWATKFFQDLPKHLNEELKELKIDIFWGTNEIPPASDLYKGRNYYLELEEIKND